MQPNCSSELSELMKEISLIVRMPNDTKKSKGIVCLNVYFHHVGIDLIVHYVLKSTSGINMFSDLSFGIGLEAFLIYSINN